MVDERAAQRMAGERWSLQLERVEKIPKMLDEGVYRVLVGRNRLVRQPVPLEVDGDNSESAIGESGHIGPEHIHGAPPSVNEHDGRRLRISTLEYSDFQTRAQSREAHAISRIAGGKHFAGTEILPAM